ncbi:arginine-glutamic acid dipeptide repeats protein-like isoform X2 [Littorina saxatilis]|uniref:arginine-glutamic acid dipeptide repeats protein-like isoform X2 n=1 Tax=Littorina saxatilis TaxID=31220 RepID=UPI0038B4493E
MADLSLDEIIATRKELNVQVQVSHQTTNRGKLNQQRQNFRPGFAAKLGVAQKRPFGAPEKRPFSAPGFRMKAGFRSSAAQNTGNNIAGPGKGQIDARDMITIKNRIKIPDARAKIVQNRIGEGTFDARSKLQPQMKTRPQGIASGGQQEQNIPFQQQQAVGPQVQQRFQKPRQQGFLFHSPRPDSQQHSPQFSQPGTIFCPQQQSQQFNQQQCQRFLQPLPANFNQPLPDFIQRPQNFSHPPQQLQHVSQKKIPDLTNFMVAVNTGQVPTEPVTVMPLTRTLVNPMASGGASVEDTGSSLKITRSIPDVTFDGQNLTITRRLPHHDQGPQPSSLGSQGPKPAIDNGRGPVIQFQNDKFQPSPVEVPTSTNIIRAQRGPLPSQERGRPRSPIQSPALKYAPVKPNPVPASARLPPALKQSSEYITNTRYKTVKNVSSVTMATRAQPQSARVLTLPQAPVTLSHQKRPLQSAFSRIHMQPEIASPSSRPASSPISATKRLAPHCSVQSQPAAVEQVSGTASAKAALKRRAALTLSDRFAAGGTGNPIPVITDQAPVKKRRMPEPDPEKEYEEDFEMQGRFEEVEAEEDDTGAPVLSPLQGFRMLVSNLHTSVTQDDIIELFGAIGPLKRANMLNKGQAEVAFIHKEHAVMALKKYHNRELDGQPMFVKLTTPLNAKIMKAPASEDSPSLPASLRTSKKPAAPARTTPVEIPLIHRALFKTGVETGLSKSVRFTVKL